MQAIHSTTSQHDAKPNAEAKCATGRHVARSSNGSGTSYQAGRANAACQFRFAPGKLVAKKVLSPNHETRLKNAEQSFCRMQQPQSARPKAVHALERPGTKRKTPDASGAHWNIINKHAWSHDHAQSAISHGTWEPRPKRNFDTHRRTTQLRDSLPRWSEIIKRS